MTHSAMPPRPTQPKTPVPAASAMTQDQRSLWTDMDLQRRTQLAQHLAALIQRMQRPPQPAAKGDLNEHH